jgi:SagB-type dehydrogenase family enzyme
MGSENVISLPEPKLKGAMSLEEAIQKRRSKRSYISQELTFEEISQLLWSVQGITDERRGFRAAPSAGALYPLKIYLVKADGLYLYLPDGHRIKRLSEKDLRQPLAQAALRQEYIAQAPIDIVICAVYERVTSKYRKRGIRYADIEAGHAAQNLQLQAVTLGLGSVPIGAFKDNAVKKVLSLPEDHQPLYIIPVGHVK